MRHTKREQIPSEFREAREKQIRIRDRLEGRPTFYPDGQPWIADIGINGKNNRR